MAQEAVQTEIGSAGQVLAKIGKSCIDLFAYLGGISQLIGNTFLTLFRKAFPLQETIKQFEEIGIKSASLTNLIALFTGLVLAVQFIVGLQRFGLQLYTGQIIGIAITRELGPVLTSLMIAARVGAGITAELGSMNVTEQIAAVEAMGANPVQKLVLPRVLACTLCAPILTVIADFVGILGGMIITTTETGVGARYFLNQITNTVQMIDFGSGIAKTFFFGFFIGVIACYQGINTEGGTEGVGRATTLSVVYSSICIFISDFFLTKLFLLL
ncbi:MAG TPA: transporter [Deltaproteobacteria bacterium]|nr:transporter [Deltaproteobacteria bacterium]